LTEKEEKASVKEQALSVCSIAMVDDRCIEHAHHDVRVLEFILMAVGDLRGQAERR
jgi:hypothetical protein